eukprot:630621-Pyramimonas_sp.AAC.1
MDTLPRVIGRLGSTLHGSRSKGVQVKSRLGQGRSGQGCSGQGRSGQGRSGQGRSGQGCSGQGCSGQGCSGQGRSGQGRSGQGCSGQGQSDFVVESEVLFCGRWMRTASNGEPYCAEGYWSDVVDIDHDMDESDVRNGMWEYLTECLLYWMEQGVSGF